MGLTLSMQGVLITLTQAINNLDVTFWIFTTCQMI